MRAVIRTTMLASVVSITLSISLANSARAEDSLPIAGMNSFIENGKCEEQEDWCLIRATDSSGGFLLVGKSKPGVDLQRIHVWGQLLLTGCSLWEMAGGRPSALATLAISDASDQTIMLLQRCASKKP
jgi:hypothetical protein